MVPLSLKETTTVYHHCITTNGRVPPSLPVHLAPSIDRLVLASRLTTTYKYIRRPRRSLSCTFSSPSAFLSQLIDDSRQSFQQRLEHTIFPLSGKAMDVQVYTTPSATMPVSSQPGTKRKAPSHEPNDTHVDPGAQHKQAKSKRAKRPKVADSATPAAKTVGTIEIGDRKEPETATPTKQRQLKTTTVVAQKKKRKPKVTQLATTTTIRTAVGEDNEDATMADAPDPSCAAPTVIDGPISLQQVATGVNNGMYQKQSHHGQAANFSERSKHGADYGCLYSRNYRHDSGPCPGDQQPATAIFGPDFCSHCGKWKW
tara:strand:- start:14697 stop:15638 length:942 start_codon:yes stop_codon:yes gene_type:complete